MVMLRCVSETIAELTTKVCINSIIVAFLIFVFAFSLAYIIILLLNNED